LILLSNNILPSLTDSWLSGFTDAEGCFTVTIKARKAMLSSGFQVFLRYILDQKNGIEIFQCLKDKLKGGNVNLRKNTNNIYRYNTSSLVSCDIIKNYFSIFPLKTKKKQSFVY